MCIWKQVKIYISINVHKNFTQKKNQCAFNSCLFCIERASSSRGNRDAGWPIPLLSSYKGCTQNDSEECKATYKLKAKL